jgi:hypothetical protein
MAGSGTAAPADRIGPSGPTVTLAPAGRPRRGQSGCGQIRAVTGPRIYPPANRGAMFLRFPGERPA